MSLKIKGFREAYSCYGRVSSLNGEPEPGVVVEAISVSGDVKYQEESKTEQDGTYRIRGLQPSVTYQIQLKKVENSHLERSAPKFRLLKVENTDLTNVNIIAFRRMNQMDVSGNVITPPDILPTLKVVLYKEDSPDSPTHSISLGTTSFFYLPSLPTDDQEFNLRLESSLSYSKYDYILPEYSFVANTAYKHVTFKFEPKRLVDQDFNQSSFLSLPLALLVLGAAYTVYKYRNNYGKRRMVDQDLLSFLMLPFAMLVTGYKYISNIFRNNYGKIVPLNTRDVFSQPASDSSNQSIAESLLPDTGSGKRKIKVRKT
ncbi:Nodal modulator 3,Nodal modulator 1,Nodal modulator 2 [Acanthosepion pharaonis]|uniref:Nodal modulator 3,Nodal modulator 1,Nodal modulator 2 n=1 Tax=Acanthosepion pharaonis TaxID=158019 RepID=A0A812D103_ACAPH|nr:Nodal modulator 3,Nodal modulator 1,Nodal modulator 2 [Sepia pharaonis]